MNAADLWAFLPIGYLVTVLIETPILFLGLSRRYSWTIRLISGFWLTACTYPIVILVLPLALDADQNWWLYVLVAEIFAPVAECLLFAAAIGERASLLRDWLTIILANLASFGLGWLIFR